MKRMIKVSLVVASAIAISASAGTLENVQKAGELKCGISTGLPGFSEVGSDKKWRGIDVDVCRAVAAAVFGDASKVKYVPLTAKERFAALQSNEIDILSRNTTWTQSRDTTLGGNFAGVTYYDGQGFLINKSLGVNSAKELDGASVCIQAGTTSELNLADYFTAHGMKFKPVTYDTSSQTRKGLEAGRCDLITSDASQLYAIKTQLEKPNDFKVLPEIISKEPLGPLVSQGDDKWFNIAKWSLNALITAEEFGITSKNVDDQYANSKVPEVQKLLGKKSTLGQNLGLDAKWAYNIIKQVGNYSESFDRNVGKDSPLKIKRGINALWKDGGILYSPPFR